jgi:hypothetical protein
MSDADRGDCPICGASCCGLNPYGQCNGAYEGLCHLSWEQAYGLPKNVADIGVALKALRVKQGADMAKKQLRMTVIIETPDGDPGPPSRMLAVFDKIKEIMKVGGTSGVFEQEFNYSQGGENNREFAIVEFKVEKIDFAIHSEGRH